MTDKKDAGNPSKQAEMDEAGKLDDRLEQLDAKLAKIRDAEATERQNQQAQRGSSSGMAMAWRLGSEFVSGVLVGGGIGWLIDTWLGLTPWGLIIFLLLGFLAGMLNMLRSAGKIPPPGA